VEYVHRSAIPAPAAAVFAWHARPGAFERLTPPWSNVRVLERHGDIRPGGRVVLRMPLGPFGVRWVAEHRDYEEGRSFRDVQVSGPFARWEHTHRVDPTGPDACTLEDRVEYELPRGALGAAVGGRMVRALLPKLFAYRHRITAEDVAAHRPCDVHCPARVAVTGASGLVGSALVPFLTTGGHAVTRLMRRADEPSAIRWDPAAGTIDAAGLEGVDAVVHLAGESIASGRWTAERKARIRDSRVRGTRLLCETLARLGRPPRTLVAASAIGWYGDRGDAVVDEASAPGSGFLTDVCREWEAAAEPARVAGIRVVYLRFGIVLSPAGGALRQLLPPFRLGVGGRVGDGRQWMSWIAVDDAVGAIHHAIVTDGLAGAVNAVAPEAVTNAAFTAVLARVLRRPAVVPVPAAAMRLALGEMADALLLASTRVRPTRLEESGYGFRASGLEAALRRLLG
jgi:uncharacterized protein (TIGR01777 family)